MLLVIGFVDAKKTPKSGMENQHRLHIKATKSISDPSALQTIIKIALITLLGLLTVQQVMCLYPFFV